MKKTKVCKNDYCPNYDIVCRLIQSIKDIEDEDSKFRGAPDMDILEALKEILGGY